MSNVTCPPASVLQPIIDVERFVIYQIAVPCFLLISFIGQTLLFLVLYKQSKTQPLYMYQVFRAVSEMIQVPAWVIYTLTVFAFLSSADPAYRSPFPALNNSYAFVWYTGHLTSAVVNSIITTSLLLSASMVADRVFALYKPMIYRSLNHKRHQAVAVVLSVGLSFAASAFGYFRFQVVDGIAMGSYKLIYVEEYLKSPTLANLAVCRVLLQAVSLLILVTLSVCLIFLFRLRFVKASVQATDQKEERRKQNEKTLTLLTLLGCTFDIVGMGLLMALDIFVYEFPAIFACYNQFLGPLSDLGTMVVKMCDFYTVFIVSKQFRKMLRESLPCKKMASNMINVAPAQPL